MEEEKEKGQLLPFRRMAMREAVPKALITSETDPIGHIWLSLVLPPRAPAVHHNAPFSLTTIMRWTSIAALLSLLASSAVATPLFTSEDQVALGGPIRTADKWEWKDCGKLLSMSSRMYLTTALCYRRTRMAHPD